MPILKTHDNKIYTSLDTINKIIAPNTVSFFPITEEMKNLADRNQFTDEIKQQLLSSLPAPLVDQYRAMNLLYSRLFIARSEFKNELDKKLTEFEKMHTNNFDEIHHLINGSAMFGLVNADGNQSVILLLPGEKIFFKNTVDHWGTVTQDYYATIITYLSISDNNIEVKQTGTPRLVTF